MSKNRPSVPFWQNIGYSFLPFADAGSIDMPLSRILRLSLFQITVGMAAVLLNGTLNRVMIVELGTPTWIVALMIAIPLLIAPFRALIGHRSDTHKSVLGWRRVPYIWFGTMMQFSGLAIMPFALILLSRADVFTLGLVASCGAFLLVGTGMHVTQTAGLALATDIAPKDKRPRVVALLYVMLLVGMMLASFVMGNLLMDFSSTRLAQVIQGAAVLSLILNVIALWKQEGRKSARIKAEQAEQSFSQIWRSFTQGRGTKRLLWAVGFGAMAFAMQDALLEPYGGEVLGMSVGGSTALTGAWALGALIAFAYCARRMSTGSDPLRLAGYGTAAGSLAFMMTLFAAPTGSIPLLFAGATAIGFGTGLFSIGTMIAAMDLSRDGNSGLALGAWGAVQASCAGLGIALGGLIRDGVSALALVDAMGATLAYRATGYGTVYTIEIILLIVTLIILGPVIGLGAQHRNEEAESFGLREFPT